MDRVYFFAFLWPYFLVADKWPRHTCILNRRRATRAKPCGKRQELTTGVSWKNDVYGSWNVSPKGF